MIDKVHKVTSSGPNFTNVFTSDGLPRLRLLDEQIGHNHWIESAKKLTMCLRRKVFNMIDESVPGD